MSARTPLSNPTNDRVTTWLLAGGVIGPPLFVVVFLIEGATRPGYSVWREQVSLLALSDLGWEQIVNFIVCGLLVLGFALVLRRALGSGKGTTWGPLLLTVFALGLVVAGLFVTDPSAGYPPGALGHHAPQTLHGTIHGLSGLTVFTSLPAACFVLARRFAGDPAWRGWTLYSLVTGVVMLGFFVAAVTTAALNESGALSNGPAGLLQRVAIIAGWSWVALLAARLLRMSRARVAPSP